MSAHKQRMLFRSLSFPLAFLVPKVCVCAACFGLPRSMQHTRFEALLRAGEASIT